MLTDLDLSSDVARNKCFPLVDWVKFFCSFLVIAIHVNPFTDINLYLDYGIKNYLARLAVPFFFVAGGYFCFRKTKYAEIDSGIPVAYAKRMIKLYLLWTVIYMPLIIRSILRDEGGVLHGILSKIRNFMFAGSYRHLWYLLASAIAILIVYWVVKKKFYKRAVVLGFLALYMIGLLGTSYFELLRPLENIQPVWKFLKLYNMVFATTRNGLFFGTIFVGVGALFAYKKIHMKQSTAIAGFVISMLLMFGEAYIVGYFNLARDNDMYVSLIPTIFFLFYIATHIDAKETTVTIALRKYSSFIYFIHLWIDFGVSIIENIVELLLGTEIYINSLFRYVLVAVGSLIASVIFYKVQEYKKLRWLKKLV